MTVPSIVRLENKRRPTCRTLVILLAAWALGLTVRMLITENAFAIWMDPVAPATAFEHLKLTYSSLPRVAVSIIAGAALGFSGAIFQHVLRNPLAEPTTLGTSAGAALALSAASLFAPGLLAFGQIWVALAGATIATTIVIFLALGTTIAPLTLLMSGLVVTLLCGSIGGVLVLLHTQYLSSLFIWSAGSLVQTDWSVVQSLVLCVGLAMAATVALLRPLSVLALDDESARSLGVPLVQIRLAALVLAASIAAFVVSAVGVISFIGLAAPAMAGLLGPQCLPSRLTWATLLGGTMLWLTDQVVQVVQTILPSVTTGTATALLAAPVLLWLLPRSRGVAPPLQRTPPATAFSRPRFHVLLIAVVLLVVLAGMTVDLGQSAQGWHFANWAELHQVLQWRWPRILASIIAGAMLATSGNLLQRLTGNNMASPEVLGLSSGAALGVIALTFIIAFPERPMQIAAAAIGALTALAGMLTLAGRFSFSPDRLLLLGIALGGLCSALVSFLLTTGDPRLAMLLSWMAGSTYAVTKDDVIACAAVGGALFAVVPLLHRWIAILPLGESTSRGAGVNIGRSRLVVLLCIALLTGAPTLILGPLTFVGLMAPHMARMLGVRRPLPQLWGSAVIGALIMLLADWLGRNLLFPYQVPAGLVATLVGGPYFLWLLRRSAR